MSSKRKTRLWDPVAKDGSYMKTTTQAMLEEGVKVQRVVRSLDQKLVNFQSFNLDDPRYGSAHGENELELPMVSCYRRHYSQPFPPRIKKLSTRTEAPDPMFNRLPRNDFDYNTGQDFKFLDDHMHNISEVRKKINLFRQMRNQSYLQY